MPWDEAGPDEPLSIAVHYDRTRLAQDDIATATATVRNSLKKNANMVMVDLGIPPGFDLLSEDLQDYQEKARARRAADWRSSTLPLLRRFCTSIPLLPARRSLCPSACAPSIRFTRGLSLARV